MRHIIFTSIILLFIVHCLIYQTAAQQNCVFGPPVVKIDFGSGDIPDVNIYLSKYEREFSRCPVDGFYSYTSATSNCFNNDWFTIDQDHSGDVKNGNMMLVNASETGGVFFNTNLDGFRGNATYQLSVSLMNVCRINGGCAPLPPNIIISIITPAGKKIGLFKTGGLMQGNVPQWKQLAGFFQTPPGTTSLKLMMENSTLGGCGNDFAMDDIIIRECLVIKPEVKEVPQLVVQKPSVKHIPEVKTLPVVKQEVIKKDTIIKPVKTDTAVFIPTAKANSEPIINLPVIKNGPEIKLPELIISRANPIVKHIEVDAGETLVELYDNGEIDGDTVTIYHNNEMIVSKAGLSGKPVSFHIAADKAKPHHELIMVADNLGSIPPNTSMMIITANNKRHEVFISSSEQKNAKVIIDLKQ